MRDIAPSAEGSVTPVDTCDGGRDHVVRLKMVGRCIDCSYISRSPSEQKVSSSRRVCLFETFRKPSNDNSKVIPDAV